mmetsp:Transcript_22121/g.50580  ORF Transcript_22121/g.50580 Transcript_22121/m.50580 type:complete len:372 (-) Transcript_22121:76-1191(-)
MIASIPIASVPNNKQEGIREETEACSFDLPNLVAINSRQVSTATLYGTESSTVSHPDEEYLLNKTFNAAQQLIAELWALPTAPSDAGPLAILEGAPSTEVIDLPRELPPPQPKAQTKWEKFAKEKGIVNSKRERKVFDEITGEWAYRYGYGRVEGKDKEWPIMEVKGGKNPYADPWEEEREAKKRRVEKNLEGQLRNWERSGIIPQGSAGRVVRARATAREKGKDGHAKGSVIPSGLPVDMQKNSQKGKIGLSGALRAAQSSTASIGQFDTMREGEPDRAVATKMKRRKFEDGVSRTSSSLEKERNKKVLESVISGNATKSDRAKKDKKLARGETAHDYDFHDGLGEHNFKKKKGRAGVGKMKKITKKHRN